MLEYTSLFADLEELFSSADRDPASFRRLQREVLRVRENLADYMDEVATDYVIRLEQRLAQPDSRLSAEEIALLRAYLGVVPADDPERDERLLSELATLEDSLQRLLALKDRPLSLKNLDGLRRQVDHMAAVLPGIIARLEERKVAQRFERAVGDGGETMNREWLLRALQRTLGGAEGTPGTDPAVSEEIPTPFGR